MDKLLKNEKFLELLDKEDSGEMAAFLNELMNNMKDYHITYLDFIAIDNLFKSLNIFQDIAVYEADSDTKYNYVLTNAFMYHLMGTTIDLRNTVVYSEGVNPMSHCTIIVDDKTVLDEHGIRLKSENFDRRYENITLIFLGIPQVSSPDSIYITGDAVKIQVKKGLKNKVMDQFRNRNFFTRESFIVNEMEEI